jgi:hypothetical protein
LSVGVTQQWDLREGVHLAEGVGPTPEQLMQDYNVPDSWAPWMRNVVGVGNNLPSRMTGYLSWPSWLSNYYGSHTWEAIAIRYGAEKVPDISKLLERLPADFNGKKNIYFRVKDRVDVAGEIVASMKGFFFAPLPNPLLSTAEAFSGGQPGPAPQQQPVVPARPSTAPIRLTVVPSAAVRTVKPAAKQTPSAVPPPAKAPTKRAAALPAGKKSTSPANPSVDLQKLRAIR